MDPDPGAWKLTQIKKINLIFSLWKWLLYLHRYGMFCDIFLHKVYFSFKNSTFVTATSDQDPDPDPHWFGSLEPDPPAALLLD